MADKPEKITQRVDEAGKPSKANDQPHWFLTRERAPDIFRPTSAVAPADVPAWGELFASARPGNDVDFFVDGQEYFTVVAAAIKGAKKSVFIAGWQVNYAVQMGHGETLLGCLDQAVENGASVYVMPWLAPPGPVDTGYLFTLLAVFHLNGLKGGKPRKGKAFCMPAMAQSDMTSFNTMFSHHQKLVAIDGEQAYIGGIDLAYGRREDGSFDLNANGRKLNEFYSQCVSPIYTPTNVDRRNCVTMMEMLMAAIPGAAVRFAGTWWTSPADAMASTWDALDSASKKMDDATQWAKEKWDDIDLLKTFTNAVKDAAVDAAENVTHWAWDELPADLRLRMEATYASGAAHLKETQDIVWAAINGVDISQMPFKDDVNTAVREAVFAFVGILMTVLSNLVGSHERYERLFDKVEQMPSSNAMPDPHMQPRQPWHDVHCRLQGPAVHDVCRNFIHRWNATAGNYNRSYRRDVNNRYIKTFVKHLPRNSSCPTLPDTLLPPRPPTGSVPNEKCWVQVLRSAPKRLLQDECLAGVKDQTANAAQNNCLKGWLQVIGASKYFLYIENQFFQSDYEGEGPLEQEWSGPAASLLALKGLSGYNKFAKKLGIEGKSIDKLVPTDIIWSAVDDVADDPECMAFINAVKQVLKNWATVQAVKKLAGSDNAQQHMINPLSKAIAARIERAIDDDQPFHVYMVVPVHPEGRLNDLALMRQLDLTMNSAAHGAQSLINAVKRALIARQLYKEEGHPVAEAKAMAKKMSVKEFELPAATKKAAEKWSDYLTLLNLRNHAVINGRPVTEQIYTHSKLLIADDRAALLGSANINDRSMLGGRDSEIAVIVAGGPTVLVPLDGEHAVPVSRVVHEFRTRLWKRIFGEKGTEPATALLSSGILASPAKQSTWVVIQTKAKDNAKAYETAFRFIPRDWPHESIGSGPNWLNEPRTACIWPTWQYPSGVRSKNAANKTIEERGHLRYRMPFDPLFWRAPVRSDDATQLSWNVRHTKDQRGEKVVGVAPEISPAGVQGFLVALPIQWMAQESNNTKMALALVAMNEDESQKNEDTQLALNTDESKTWPETVG